MFKYSVFLLVLWYQIRIYICAESVAKPLVVMDPNKYNFSEIAEEWKKRAAVAMNGHNNYHVGQQIFYVYGEQQLKRLLPDNKENLDGYYTTPDIGTYKYHYIKTVWNNARKICIAEGGHLAIINSAAEEKHLLDLLQQHKGEQTWLGLHDMFEEGDWLTIKDEPLENIGYINWGHKVGSLQPDNYGGNEHCATLSLTEDGMYDRTCDTLCPFICEIPV